MLAIPDTSEAAAALNEVGASRAELRELVRSASLAFRSHFGTLFAWRHVQGWNTLWVFVNDATARAFLVEGKPVKEDAVAHVWLHYLPKSVFLQEALAAWACPVSVRRVKPQDSGPFALWSWEHPRRCDGDPRPGYVRKNGKPLRFDNFACARAYANELSQDGDKAIWVVAYPDLEARV